MVILPITIASVVLSPNCGKYMGLNKPESSVRLVIQLPGSIIKPRMATIIAMVIHEKAARKMPKRKCFSLASGDLLADCQLKKYAMIRLTSVTNTIHSVNQPQKNTRIKLPMAAGFIKDAENQIPTPVNAPTVVVIITIIFNSR